MKKRKLHLLNAFIVLLFVGLPFAWSLFVVPLEKAYGWNRSMTSLAFTGELIFFSIGAIVAGKLSEKISFSKIVKLSAIFLGSGFFLAGFASQYPLILITYSFGCGIGCGMSYNTLLSCIPLWFPEKTATINGTLLVGYALSSALLGPIITLLISYFNVQIAFHIIGIVSFIVIFFGSYQVQKPTPQDLDTLPAIKNQNRGISKDYQTKEMIKTPHFYFLFLAVVFAGGTGSALINHASPMIQEDFKMTAKFAAIIISTNSVFNATGRITWGILFDKIGMKRAVILDGLFLISSGLFIVFSLFIHSIVLFILGNSLLMIGFGGTASNIPSIIRKLFGDLHFAMNYSIMNLNAVLASFIPSVIGIARFASVDYITPSVIISIFMILAFILYFLLISIKMK